MQPRLRLHPPVVSPLPPGASATLQARLLVRVNGRLVRPSQVPVDELAGRFVIDTRNRRRLEVRAVLDNRTAFVRDDRHRSGLIDLRSNRFRPVVTVARVRAASTPAGTMDRIPPRVDTPVQLVVGLTSQPYLYKVVVEGQNAQNGRVTINGRPQLLITRAGSHTLRLCGTTQTLPGSGASLRLAVYRSGRRIAISNCFAVAAVPTGWTTVEGTRMENGEWNGTTGWYGLTVTEEVGSDSGNAADLDQVETREVLRSTSKTGSLRNLPVGDSGYLPADSETLDDHAVDRAAVRGEGRWVVEQGHQYKCLRTGATNVPIAGSGCIVSMTVTQRGRGRYRVHVEKRGAIVTVEGVTYTAAQGRQQATVDF